MAIVALFGTQFLLMGLLGEYVARIFEESKNRPLYVVREARGFERPSAKQEPEPAPSQQEKPPKRFVLYT
jgi:dolichol-phosphate mannosyltransferase